MIARAARYTRSLCRRIRTSKSDVSPSRTRATISSSEMALNLDTTASSAGIWTPWLYRVTTRQKVTNSRVVTSAPVPTLLGGGKNHGRSARHTVSRTSSGAWADRHAGRPRQVLQRSGELVQLRQPGGDELASVPGTHIHGHRGCRRDRGRRRDFVGRTPNRRLRGERVAAVDRSEPRARRALRRGRPRRGHVDCRVHARSRVRGAGFCDVALRRDLVHGTQGDRVARPANQPPLKLRRSAEAFG